MSRHPAPVMASLSAQLPRTYADFWEIMRRLDASQGSFTLRDVDGKTAGDVHTRSVRNYLIRLVRGGYAEHAGIQQKPNGRKAKLYRLVKRPKTAPKLRRDGSERPAETSQGRLWRTMKMLRTFTVRELAVAASFAEATITRQTAKSYLTHLVAAGYVTLDHNGSSRAGIYRLKPQMNTGPQAPQIMRTKFVWDPNLQQVMGDNHVAEEVRK